MPETQLRNAAYAIAPNVKS